ncbi:uncharacterized protein LACBIDRAFT_311681 [Laccaria bicolor S238N-H82]|uniref:Predicted protein n=1 Tax=Laccaria bicolor (strain S238N-H82 / ATCC MYA-4686) TaxID=486041 RepID=B0CY10_LACBS|nr:uncharacterized protein LACBIDRAFT_311681 [Laccaria bicolor S238N-H82]EDR12812.1 predicted protein [Laccaria bicolor S238N-H82]|eukprot:XP_001877076.1 predicted protein [Laccaria bicolor S238N-H82]
MSEHTAIGKLNADAASGGVLLKLIIFSLSLGILPLTSYFASLKYVWDGNATFAAITAVVAANIVLVTYIVMSLLEDKRSSVQQQHTETRKEK